MVKRGYGLSPGFLERPIASMKLSEKEIATLKKWLAEKE